MREVKSSKFLGEQRSWEPHCLELTTKIDVLALWAMIHFYHNTQVLELMQNMLQK